MKLTRPRLRTLREIHEHGTVYLRRGSGQVRRWLRSNGYASVSKPSLPLKWKLTAKGRRALLGVYPGLI